MGYVIAGGDEKNPLYLTGITKSALMEWEVDNTGRIVRMVRPRYGKGRVNQVVGNYLPEIEKAKKFRTEEAARKMIRENPVLRYCRVVEV